MQSTPYGAYEIIFSVFIQSSFTQLEQQSALVWIIVEKEQEKKSHET